MFLIPEKKGSCMGASLPFKSKTRYKKENDTDGFNNLRHFWGEKRHLEAHLQWEHWELR